MRFPETTAAAHAAASAPRTSHAAACFSPPPSPPSWAAISPHRAAIPGSRKHHYEQLVPQAVELALHATIQRIDEPRRLNGEAAEWEEELAEIRTNYRK